jgi:regulator of sirC expression with transglutaminase-like and TPR domain
VKAPNPHLDYFAALVRDDAQLPLTEAAIALAQDAYPQLDVQTELVTLDAWGQQLRERIAFDAPPAFRLRALRRFFYDELGFKGNREHYYDPANSYLNRVMITRRGIPISLAVLLLELGQQAGLQMHGIAFPGHFLLKVSAKVGEMHEIILDPFSGAAERRESLEERLAAQAAAAGQRVQLELLLRNASPRAVLVRMLRNLQAVYRHLQSWRNLLAVQHRLVILLPDAPAERRERGLLHARLGERDEAIEDLQFYLQAMPQADDTPQMREQLQALLRPR